MKRLVLSMMIVVLTACRVLAQDTDAQTKAREALRQKMTELDAATTSLLPPTNNLAIDAKPVAVPSQPPVPKEAAENGWSFSASAYTYLQENDRDYVQPTITADHGWLHLEARYNYEDYETASLWVGYNFSFEKEVAVTLTPMIGGVLGETDGFAAGFRLNAEWWKLTLASEGESFFDAEDSTENYAYTWTELNLDVSHGFRVGLVMQKETSEDVRRGFSVGYNWNQKHLGEVDLAAYVFDPDEDNPMYVFAVGLAF